MAWTAKDEECLNRFLRISHEIERVMEAIRSASGCVMRDSEKDNWLEDAIVDIQKAARILEENDLDECYNWSEGEPLLQEAIAKAHPNRQPIEFRGLPHHTWHDVCLQSCEGYMADLLDACEALQDDHHDEFYDFKLLRRKRSCIWKWTSTCIEPKWEYASTGILNERALVTAYARQCGRGEIVDSNSWQTQEKANENHEDGVVFSSDYRTCKWFEEELAFTPKQAGAVRFMATHPTRRFAVAALNDALRTEGQAHDLQADIVLTKLFKDHPAGLGRLFVQHQKGIYEFADITKPLPKKTLTSRKLQNNSTSAAR